jgi:hypothetical protein
MYPMASDVLNALPNADEVGQLIDRIALPAISPLVIYEDNIVESESLLLHI